MTYTPATTVAVLIGLGSLAFLLAIAFTRIPEQRDRHWLILFGVVVFPGLALALGVHETIDASKRPEFCGSCHVMDPWVRDLHDPSSTNLASVHFQNRYILEDQCYTCHTDYGLGGPLRAKLTGMVHLFKYETGTYTLPIELYHPYNFANCLRCHGESKRYRDAHADALDALADGSMGCTDCHEHIHPEQEAKK